ncbi:MAG: hypothetical protein P1V36_04065 [Planctomycetota bacterium]|nr:hypothetical protein [Planctomycetota bacterium]
MDDRYDGGGRFGSHGAAPYRIPAWLPMAALALLLLLPGRAEAAGPVRLKATGAARRFQVKVIGGHATFRFSTVAGCRYRLTVRPGTLARPILQVGRHGEEPLVRVDPGAGGGPAVHRFDAERDASMEARVGGFSGQTGGASIQLETLDLTDRKTKAHRRFLAPTEGESARVGELLIGEANRWRLVVEPGAAYRITPTRGSAGRVRLVVLGWDGAPLADSTGTGSAWLALPPVRFRVPPKPEDAKLPALMLEVRSLLAGGGTYGVRMQTLPPDQDLTPAEVGAPEALERGPIEGAPESFRAGPGDVAVLYVPAAPGRTRVVEMQRGERWIRVEDMGLGSSARSQENALMVWFQPYYPGTYRFRDPFGAAPQGSRMLLHDRAALGSAPIHMGTGADPTPRARLRSAWSLVGLGICMPGWDYLFVCVHGPDSGVAMRVVDAAGKAIKTRSSAGRTISPGLGPSLRFRVPRAGVYRLEAKSKRRMIVRPLLRRAAD